MLKEVSQNVVKSVSVFLCVFVCTESASQTLGRVLLITLPVLVLVRRTLSSE